MIRLKTIIDVRDIPPCAARLRQALPSIRTLVRPTASPDEAKVLDYLRQGVVCGAYNDPRLLYDVLTPGNRFDSDANLLLTDGLWLWPKVLHYYLTNYHLELPAAFVEHAQKNDWRIDPETISRQELDDDAFDAIPATEPCASPVAIG